MTPKEKAEELYSKFCQFTPADEEYEHEYTKKCALIAVDVILNDVGAKDWLGDRLCGGKNYWKEVRKQIEKL